MNRFKKSLQFIISLIAALGLAWILREPSFSQAQTYVLFLLCFSIGLWLTEAVPPFAVGLLIIAYLAFTLGSELFTTTPQDVKIYLNTFSSNVIWLMIGGFFLASAMTKTKLDADLIRLAMKVCGSDPKRVLFGLMMVTMVFSMLISNTATTAMVIAALMPLLVKLGKQSPVAKGLVLGIPIAATTGGMGTIIGSPPNAIAVGALATAGQAMDFVTWMYYGLPMTLFLTWLSWWVLVKRFLGNSEPLSVGDSASPGAAITREYRTKRLTVIAILTVTLALWLTSPIHHLGAAAVSAIPLVFLPMTGILKGEDIRSIGWDTLILVAGGLALGTALQQTGLLGIYAGRLASLQVPNIVFYLVLAYATMLFSNVMSNTATSTVLIPLGMAILPGNSIEVCMIVGLSASTALFLPVSTPPNAIAYSTGFIEQKDLRLGGLLMGVVGPAFIIAWVLLIGAMRG
ncbi:MAG: DASS family sodium-coupled anion symporter [Planctomycetes bacterium]|jgi:sodium-dependent dicarboxylate transporter 2/3/5|nr:DASS family sodium-coupled anion symporter [Planctomycetota bacterium]